jgi:hypothetical protein
MAGVEKAGNIASSLDREGKLRHTSSNNIAGNSEASTFDGNCRRESRECKSSDEGDGTEEEHFFEKVGWCLMYDSERGNDYGLSIEE